jgi:D-arabinose 1-dehydrogenase-like Zn-dependent alcohol dehydrogenase
VRALQIDEWGGALHQRTLSDPIAGPGQVRLRVLACGVGLTVVNAVDGLLSGDGRASLPRVPGHEICGEVLEVGPGVGGLKCGDLVVAYFYLSCSGCRFCRTDRVPLCQRFRGFVGVDIDGGYAEQVVIEAFNAVPIPSDLDPAAATTIPDAVATPLHVCGSRAMVRPGETVLVIGAGGGVGVHMVQVVGLFGGRVGAVDVSEKKLELATEAGASVAIPAGTDPSDTERALGGPADVVIDLVGNQATLDYAVACAGPGARVVMLAPFPNVGIALPAREAVLEETAVLGSKYASMAEVRRAVELVASGQVQPVVSEVTDLNGVAELHRRLRARQLSGRAAVVPQAAAASVER